MPDVRVNCEFQEDRKEVDRVGVVQAFIAEERKRLARTSGERKDYRPIYPLRATTSTTFRIRRRRGNLFFVVPLTLGRDCA